MAEAEGADPDESHVESVVLDLTEVPLDDLTSLPLSVLGETLRRLHSGRPAGDPFVTGFSESL